MPFAATWMELETLIPSEVNQKEKDKYHVISYVWNLIYSTKESFHRKENHGHGEQTCACHGGGGGEGVEWIANLGLTDANYCSWNGFTMRSC